MQRDVDLVEAHRLRRRQRACNRMDEYGAISIRWLELRDERLEPLLCLIPECPNLAEAAAALRKHPWRWRFHGHSGIQEREDDEIEDTVFEASLAGVQCCRLGQALKHGALGEGD